MPDAPANYTDPCTLPLAAASATPPISDRFRPTQRPLSTAEAELIASIKAKAAELEWLYGFAAGKAPAGDFHWLEYALKALENSVMWIVKEITA